MKTGQGNGQSKNKTKLFESALVKQWRVALLDLKISKALKEKNVQFTCLFEANRAPSLADITEQLSCKKSQGKEGVIKGDLWACYLEAGC